MSSLGFKDLKVLRGILCVPWHPILIALLDWCLVRFSTKKVLITCAYEKRDYVSVHDTNPLRGFDLRSRLFSNPEEIAEEVNRHWTYDPQRPEKKVCVCHDTGRGRHLHFQVHPNTIYLGG